MVFLWDLRVLRKIGCSFSRAMAEEESSSAEGHSAGEGQRHKCKEKSRAKLRQFGPFATLDKRYPHKDDAYPDPRGAT